MMIMMTMMVVMMTVTVKMMMMMMKNSAGMIIAPEHRRPEVISTAKTALSELTMVYKTQNLSSEWLKKF